MIKCEVDAHRTGGTVEAYGSDIDLVGEISFVVCQIYASTKQINPKAAERFRGLMMISMLPESPVWTLPSIVEGVSCVLPDKSHESEDRP